MNDLLKLHFEPHYFIHYQEPNGIWRKDTYENIFRGRNSIKRLQYNTTKYKNYVIIDIDNENLFSFENKDIPKPNIIIKNRHKEGGHLFYFLDRTISHPYYETLWKKVLKYYSFVLSGDIFNVGYIGKNILNEEDFEIIEIEKTPYNIKFLSNYVKDIPNKEKTFKIDIKTTQIETKTKKECKTSKSRNVDLFNELRFIGYDLIKKSHNEEDFYFILFNKGIQLNNDFEKPLQKREVKEIINSIYRYCVKNKEKIKKHTKKRRIMDLNDDLTLKEKQKLSQEYMCKVRTSKTEMKIKVSILEMKKKNLKINISAVSKYTKLSRNTISKYKNLLEEI